MISCILLAAGAGKRMGRGENKLFCKIGTKSIFQMTVQKVLSVQAIDELIIVAAPSDTARLQNELAIFDIPIPLIFATGGKERQDSLAKGLEKVNQEAEIVVTHDGARPLATSVLFERVIAAAEKCGAATVGVAAKNTIKRIDASGFVVETLRRSDLMEIQTPQASNVSLLRQSLEHAEKTGFLGTDDMSLIEHYGHAVQVVEGDYVNKKLTTPEDLLFIKEYLGVKETMMRVGYGYDVHRFKEGRPCVLGGIHIDSSVGPDGHSDGDVIVHALMDALLGAAGLRDIGFYFPPNDDSYKGISSLRLLEKVMQLLSEKGVRPYNIDIMVIAEIPKINPHIEEMKQALSKILGVETSYISIKATTNEGLGAIGNKEGILAQTVVTIRESEA